VTRSESRPTRSGIASSAAGLGLAVGMVGTALGLTLYLQSVVSTADYLFFYIAVVSATWFGGAWPGALAVCLSFLAVEYYFMAPVHSFHLSREALPVFIEFAASCSVIGWFSSWRRRAEKELQDARDLLQIRVDERTAELRQSNEQLLAEIAERKRAEDAYREAQGELARVTRISAMGALAASISHEVNQPLAAVVTNADACMMWLSTEPPNLEEVRFAMEAIVQEGTRASDVVKRIRAMFTKGRAERASLAVNSVIDDAVSLISTEALRHETAIELDLAADLPLVRADRVQLQQVLVNLMQNAIEAMKDVPQSRRRVVIRSEQTTAAELSVAVRDFGPGIDPKDRKRVFDAFFTTKSGGMGMGLAISHSIIDAHGGRLWATANSDFGTTFQFTLPLVQEREA
jgi:C4-dicarboxylate-specific signal transduction histidine kinase